jgi:hypothetical protein
MFGVELASHSAAIMCGDGYQGFRMLCQRVWWLVIVGRAGGGEIGGEGEGMWRDFPSTGSKNHYYLSVGRLADGGLLFTTF